MTGKIIPIASQFQLMGPSKEMDCQLQQKKTYYCILRGQIKGFNSSITTILFEVGSYRTVVG